MIALRPYQDASIAELGKGIQQGMQRQVLCSPTGSGKTIIAATIIKRALAKGRSATFIVDRLSLVDQTSQVFWNEGIPHGIVQGDNTHGRNELIKICSAQTLESRGLLPSSDLFVWDECHAMRRYVVEAMMETTTPVIGLTATPFTKGMADIFSRVVNVTTTNKLIKDGFLAPLRVFAAREIDMTGAKVVAGEWTDKDVRERAMVIIGDVVEEWRDKTNAVYGKPMPTLVFTPDVAYGEELVRAFQSIGHDFRQISYRSDEEERKRDIQDFANGRCMGLISCEALAKGFDAPNAEVLIDARPYRKSLAAHIQKLGRIMRPYPGKQFGMVLDHAGNYRGFYKKTEEFFANGVSDLKAGLYLDKPRETIDKEKDPILCPSCHAVMGPDATTCPVCGHTRVRRSNFRAEAGDLVEVVGGHQPPKGPKFKQDPYAAWLGCCEIAYTRKRGDFQGAKAQALGVYRSLFGEWPDKTWRFDITQGCATSELNAHFQKSLIAYAKSKKTA